MLQEERYSRILSELAERGAVKVSDLAISYGTSESTIRRDINDLAAEAKLKKVFGGAVPLDRPIKTVEEDMTAKASVRVKEKESVARYAAALLSDHDFVFLDAGTTTERMIDFVEKESVTFVTNGITHAQKLARRGFKVYMTGGQLKPATLSVVGTEAVRFLEKCNFTKCFLGVNGIDPKRGLTTPGFDEAQIKTEAMERSSITYVLTDESKFGCVSAATFGRLEDVCIITDRLADREFEKYTVIKEAESGSSADM